VRRRVLGWACPFGGTPARNLGTQAPLRRQSKKEKILEPELDGGAIPNLMACTSKNH